MTIQADEKPPAGGPGPDDPPRAGSARPEPRPALFPRHDPEVLPADPIAPASDALVTTPGLARTGALLAALGFLTKVTGFLRITAITSHLGAIRETDAFLTAFLIPETLYLFLTEGALTAAFIPVFTRHAADGRASFGRLLGGAVLAAAAIGSLLGLALGLSGTRVAALVAPGFEPAAQALTGDLLSLVSLYLPVTLVAAVLSAALNAAGHFLAPALGPLLFNLAVIGSVPYSSPGDLTPLALGVLAGGVLQFAVLVPALLARIGPSLLRPGFHSGLREMLVLMLPLTFTSGLMQVQVLAERTIASGLEPGVITNLNLVQKLSNLPLGLFGLAIALPLFPVLSRAWQSGDPERFAALVSRGLAQVFVLITPIAWFFALEAPALIDVLFRRAAYGSDSAHQAAAMLTVYSASLPAITASYLLAGAFLATADAKTPAFVKGLLHAGNVLLNFQLVAWLDWVTIPFCYTLMYDLNLVVLMALLSRRFPPSVRAGWLGPVATAVLVWTVAALVDRSILDALGGPASGPGRLGASGMLFLSVGAGLAWVARRRLGMSAVT